MKLIPLHEDYTRFLRKHRELLTTIEGVETLKALMSFSEKFVARTLKIADNERYFVPLNKRVNALRLEDVTFLQSAVCKQWVLPVERATLHKSRHGDYSYVGDFSYADIRAAAQLKCGRRAKNFETLMQEHDCKLLHEAVWDALEDLQNIAALASNDIFREYVTFVYGGHSPIGGVVYSTYAKYMADAAVRLEAAALLYRTKNLPTSVLFVSQF